MTGTNAAPIGAAERIDTLDVVRGFALLGILLMNIVAMGLPFPAYLNPTALGAPTEAEIATWWITNSFFEGSMRTLFSMLFGAGFVLLLDRLDAKGLGLMGAKIGDILLPYALSGVFLLVFWRSKIRGLVLWAALFFLATSLFNVGGGFKFAESGAFYAEAVAARDAGETLSEDQTEILEDYPEMRSFFKPTEEGLEEEIEAHQSWASLAGYNFGGLLENTFIFILMFGIFDPLAAMLLGMIAFRIGLLQGAWSTRSVLLLTVVAWGIGLPVNILESQQIMASGYTVDGFFAAMRTYDIGRVSLAFGWLGLFLLLCKSPLMGVLRTVIGAVGRMALTNYLAHSAIAAIVFVGFGLYNQLDRNELYYVVAGCWVFNIIFSILWLSVFRIGPMEWLWRAGTYGNWPPLLKSRT